MPQPTARHTDTRHEIAHLRTQNHRLRLFAAAVLGAGVGAATLGFTAGAEPRDTDLVSITSDGTYLYALLRDGRIYRLDIETREDANKQRPDIYYTRPINRLNLFYPSNP
jgi:hypothetical protein